MAASGRIQNLFVVQGVALTNSHLNGVLKPVVIRHRLSSAHGESVAILQLYLVLVRRLPRNLLQRLLPLAGTALRR